MKSWLTSIFVGLLIVAAIVPANAWEFSMTGEYEYRFRYLGRTGQNDLFGYDTAIPGGSEVGFAGPNIYGYPAATAHTAPAPTGAALGGNTYGLLITQGGYSQFGSDALYYDSRLTLYPDIRVNPAARIHGSLNIGGIRNKYAQPAVNVPGSSSAGIGVPPFERYYVSQTSDNAYDTASIISVEQFRATIQFPMGTMAIGVKDFPFGIGSNYAKSSRSEGFLFVAPYGPWRMLGGLWLARNASNGNWGMAPDTDRKPSFFGAWLFTYEQGAWDIGGGYVGQNYYCKNFYDTAKANGRGGYNQSLAQWIAYFKYNNGRFFMNAEYDWATQEQYAAAVNQNYTGSAAQRNVVTPKYTEIYHWFAELGAMCGPAKVTLMAATASGPVVNNANPTKVYTGYPINYQAMEPYEWLMFNTYGGGNDAFSGPLMPSDGHGMMSDAYCYAARLDYAAAANLNIFGSYIWAHRLEKQGYLFGGKSSAGTTATAADIALFAANAGRAPSTYQVGGVTGTTYGYVTDGYLGWEADAGVDWKLLENVSCQMKYAYWQPGNWFKEAYQTKGVLNGAANVNLPLDTRAPINAFHWSVLVYF